MEEELEKEFVTYEIGFKLKELGFDKICLAVHYKGKLQLVKNFNINNVDLYVANEFSGILAPLWQQVIDWMLIIHGLSIEFNVCNDAKFHYEILSWANRFFDGSVCVDSKDRDEFYNSLPFDNKYQAREHAILKAIELIKDKK